jgi:hypothetical protein
MLGYTVLTKVDKIGLVGNWIPVLKQLTSDYTCQICTQTAAKCNLGFHKIDRLVRTQRESSLEAQKGGLTAALLVIIWQVVYNK